MAKEKAEKRAVPKSIEDLMKTINKTHGDGSVMRGKGSIVNVDTFPTSIATVDKALGSGLPMGRIIEIHGMESSGKTTTCLQIMKACQQFMFPKKKRKGVVAFIDAEHAYDPVWAGKCGVDVDNVLFSQPDNGEEAFDILERFAESGLVDLIVVDSVAALIPKAQLEGDIGETHIGAQARLMSKGLAKIKATLNNTQTTVIFINQIRQKIGVMYGSPDTTPGGLALKFYASVRASISKGSPIKEGNEVIGFTPKIKFIKNKCATPFSSAEFAICFGIEGRPFGVDEEASLLEIGQALGVIQLKGSMYTVGSKKANGFDAALKLLRDNRDLVLEIREKVYGNFKNALPVVDAIENENTEEATDDDLHDDILDNLKDGDDE
jgi:recombination protein RecA